MFWCFKNCLDHSDPIFRAKCLELLTIILSSIVRLQIVSVFHLMQLRYYSYIQYYLMHYSHKRKKVNARMQSPKERKRIHNFGAVHKFFFSHIHLFRGNFQLISLPINRHPPLQLNIILSTFSSF